jgi:hypothetical protein
MTGPARITIELEPPRHSRDRWVARTRVEQPMEPLPAPDQREPAVVPAGYEPPADCTCLDGFCAADHANE